MIYISLFWDDRPDRRSHGSYKQSGTESEELEAPGREGPIYMLNLLKFKEKSCISSTPDKPIARESFCIWLGWSSVFSADVERLMLGEVEELWDMTAVPRIN